MPIWAVRVDEAFPGSGLSSLPHETLVPLLHLVDQDSADQIQKFRRLVDAQRCLLGRLLPRYLIASRYGLSWPTISFAKTATGRPYSTGNSVPSSLDFNISHDSNWVVMAWDEDRSVGVDVMKAHIPWQGETVDQFVAGLDDQLTTTEKGWLSSSATSKAKLRRVFALWTLKEAYSKAIGHGLGFDFQRIEFRFTKLEAPNNSLWDTVKAYLDGKDLPGWSFGLLDMDEDHILAVAVHRDTVPPSSLQVEQVSLDEMVAASQTT